MKDQTNEEPLDPMPGELPVTAGRPGSASAQHGGKHGAAPVDPDALFRQMLAGVNLNLAWKQVRANKGAPGIRTENALLSAYIYVDLRDRDIANMGFAEAVDCPVVIVADIDRGGVFAHLVGTLQLLSASERRRVVGFVINRFRGELALLRLLERMLDAQTGALAAELVAGDGAGPQLREQLHDVAGLGEVDRRAAIALGVEGTGLVGAHRSAPHIRSGATMP